MNIKDVLKKGLKSVKALGEIGKNNEKAAKEATGSGYLNKAATGLAAHNKRTKEAMEALDDA